LLSKNSGNDYSLLFNRNHFASDYFMPFTKDPIVQLAVVAFLGHYVEPCFPNVISFKIEITPTMPEFANSLQGILF